MRPECVDADPASYLSLGWVRFHAGEADERGLVSLRSGVVFLVGVDVKFVRDASFREGCVPGCRFPRSSRSISPAVERF